MQQPAKQEAVPRVSEQKVFKEGDDEQGNFVQQPAKQEALPRAS